MVIFYLRCGRKLARHPTRTIQADTTMKTPSLLTLAASAALVSSASAIVTMDWVSVGNPGNAADTADGDSFTSGIQNYGAVAYAYQIGKYEVTNAQYVEFLNAADPGGANVNGIYDNKMGRGGRGGITYTEGAAIGAKYTLRTNMGDKPVVYVSWFDAARFANWMMNGQGAGSTESGAYTLNGETSGIILKNSGASVWLPSEDEWYKAAYYDPTPGAGGGDNYWFHATQSDIAPTSATADANGDINNPGANVANYHIDADWNGEDGNLTTVGSAMAKNYFGTSDMSGNVFEWNDAVKGIERGQRGGSWADSESDLFASFRWANRPPEEFSTVGFRLASVPEPSSLVLTAFFGAGLVCRRKR